MSYVTEAHTDIGEQECRSCGSILGFDHFAYCIYADDKDDEQKLNNRKVTTDDEQT